MAEWLKAHDSKSCGPKGLGGSNPLASAINVGIEKDSIESFYLFKLKLKKGGFSIFCVVVSKMQALLRTPP